MNTAAVIEGQIERVARALCEHHIRDARRFDTPADELNAMMPESVDYSWHDHIPAAQAAIAVTTPAEDWLDERMLRDAFAMAALAMTAPSYVNLPDSAIAKRCYMVADAMLAASRVAGHR